MTPRIPVFLALLVLAAGLLAGCAAPDTRPYIGAFEQNPELRELFRLFGQERDEEKRFVLIQQIAINLANAGRTDREILFLTTHVERNPADIFDAYYLSLVADAYKDLKAVPFAVHYYRRILNNHADLLVQGRSVHLYCLQELIGLDTNPANRIAYYKELISRFGDQVEHLGSAYFSMARSYEELGEWEQAIQSYQRYLDYPDPEIPGVADATRISAEKVLFFYSAEGLARARPERPGVRGPGGHRHEEPRAAQQAQGQGELLCRGVEPGGPLGGCPAGRSDGVQRRGVSLRFRGPHGPRARSLLDRPGRVPQDDGLELPPADLVPVLPQGRLPRESRRERPVGMGWNLLRRTALAAALASLLPAGAGASPGPLPGDRVPRAPQPGPAGQALAPAQTHRAGEVYWLEIPDEDVIDRYVERLLAGRRDWLQVVLDRSRQYSRFIAEQVRARGLPRELAFLPALESGFQSRAVSHKGAAGLWQLMRNTSAPYGLRTDHWIDERRDFWKATEASLSKLAENHRRFGDWEMALAAYNCGAGKLSRIVRQNPGLDYWALRSKGVLPRETAAFVPQFMALARILSHPGRHGLETGWKPSPRWTRVAVEGSVDLRILASRSGVPLETLAGANPELNFSMTPPRSYGYMLKVPREHGRAIEETLASAAVPLLDFDVHVVRSGDTLSEIAQSFGVSVSMIMEFNPSVKPLALRVGSRILVPRTGPAQGRNAPGAPGTNAPGAPGTNAPGAPEMRGARRMG